VPAELRRRQLDGLRELNELNYALVGDPETHTRIQQFEMAFRMQSSVPSSPRSRTSPPRRYELYGEEARKPGTFAYTCLLAAAWSSAACASSRFT